MTRFLSIAGACLLVAASPLGSPSPSAQAQIRAAYVTLQHALLKNDPNALTVVLAPDFRHRDADGSVEGRQAYVKDQTENTPGLVVATLRVAITTLNVHGGSATAETTYTLTGTYAYEGAPKPFRGVVHLTDDWSLVGRKWMLRFSAVRDLTSIVDGKVVQDEREQLAPAQAAIAELRTRAVAIPTLALDADPDQFAAIGTAIGDARLVGMGEGTHGTSEFFAFKNRLFKYLVERKHFTVFAMEAYWGAGLDVDRYIKGGPGTAQQAVASLAFWTWNTPEVVDLIRWMRDYNMALGRHPIVTFVGVDMQDPMGAIGYLAQYLRSNDPGEFVVAHEALACSADAAARLGTKPTADCRRRVADIAQQLTSMKSASGVAIAQKAVTNILQYLDFAGQPESVALQLRDQDMATNVQWAAAHYAGQKIALWAHNGHVGSTAELSYRPMGSYLRQAFGPAYYVIGQTLGSGTVRAIVRKSGLESVNVPPNPGDTIAQLFSPLDAAAFLDLRGLPAGSALQTFFATQHGVWETGAVMDPANPRSEMSMVVPNSFDALVYIPISTASVSAVGAGQLQRAIRERGADWETTGPGFDDVTVFTNPTGARLTNADALNASDNDLLRRLTATPYAGKSVAVTGEVRTDDLLGYVLPLAEARTSDATVVATQRGDTVDSFKNAGWTPITLTMKVPANASFIDAGFMAEGSGSVDVRNLMITATH